MRKRNSQQLGSGGLQWLMTPASKFISVIAPYIPLNGEGEDKSVKSIRQQNDGSPSSFSRQSISHLTTTLHGKCPVQGPGLGPPRVLVADHC